MKVLVVDDDSVSLALAIRAVSKHGHQVISCSSSGEAWERYRSGGIHAILSDWMMPDMDGLELCRKVRTLKTRIYPYFILLTARSSQEDFQQAMEAGVDDFLAKPLDPIELMVRLRVAERIIQFGEQLTLLKEIIPVCMYCRKIRTDDEYWERFEAYFGKYKETKFSHGVCPECYREHVLPELEALKSKEE
ncbi:MAG: hypothetical protein OHK005_02270 [Candidatus Methylacidiphilales bacterium]